jgi:hypothetical protein
MGMRRTDTFPRFTWQRRHAEARFSELPAETLSGEARSRPSLKELFLCDQVRTDDLVPLAADSG